MTRQMHLSLNLTEYGRHDGAWRDPAADTSRIPNLAAYVHAVQWAEKGCFDQAFFADTPVHPWGRVLISPSRVDPLEMAAVLTEATERIGIITTVSTTYNEPFDVARRGAALSLLCGGRLGLNYVASSGDHVARNFGHPGQLPHDERYVRSNEFLEVVTDLWARAATPTEPAEPLAHHGAFFDVEGSLDVHRPPLGRPIIVQAGSSEEGRDLAARWADAIYAAGSTIPRAQEFYADIKRRAADHGRDPDTVKVMLGICPFLGETQEEAEALHARLDGYHAEGADTIGFLGTILEADLSAYDPDGPLPLDELPEDLAGIDAAGSSMGKLFRRMAAEEEITIRQLAHRAYVGGLGNMQFVATGTPEHVADVMQEWFEAGTCDGFSLVAPSIGQTIEAFVTHVVPILQERGLMRTGYEADTLAGHFGLETLGVPGTPSRAAGTGGTGGTDDEAAA
ncbi:NtaA/DmoA family FMN-dependent monooxygenase [Nocardioides bruguierae]|uniref:NtaA/DmoA family FMN-dependent monooxygenase n=1 Tax=Nocardioides bruguierae TaxID=2945102 RepID=A0A9X2D857_9ACTN|nr:NtaA/DmoA family FMN-dependent monooxygenase [Nocardioides bruguierae]MCM0621131.1 NtaA/DmoA family FMN-dependent monooxygenase [Nocardioides bruguierae]